MREIYQLVTENAILLDKKAYKFAIADVIMVIKILCDSAYFREVTV